MLSDKQENLSEKLKFFIIHIYILDMRMLLPLDDSSF